MPARFSSLFVRRPPPLDGPAPAPPAAEAAPVEVPAPPPPPRRPPSLQRERRVLARQREIEIRDVGGLAVEMARRDVWRDELLRARCAEVLGLERRLLELDSLLVAAQVAAYGGHVEQCKCGAPILRGTHFCSHCGRPAADTPPVVACSHCGQPLPADANFCSTCGNAVAAEVFEQEVADATGADEPPYEGPPRRP